MIVRGRGDAGGFDARPAEQKGVLCQDHRI